MRLSLDAKDKVRIGKFARGGASRVQTDGLDHDFYDETITPFGIFLPDFSETYLYMTQTYVSSDFIVDAIEDFWKTYKDKATKTKKAYKIEYNSIHENNNKRRTRSIYRDSQSAKR